MSNQDPSLQPSAEDTAEKYTPEQLRAAYGWALGMQDLVADLERYAQEQADQSKTPGNTTGWAEKVEAIEGVQRLLIKMGNDIHSPNATYEHLEFYIRLADKYGDAFGLFTEDSESSDAQ